MYAPTPPPPLLLSSLHSTRSTSRPTSARQVRPSSSVINSMPRPPPLSTSVKIPRVNSAPFPISNMSSLPPLSNKSRRGLEAGSSQPQLQFPPHTQQPQLQIKHQLAVPHTALALVQKNNPTNFSNAESILSSPPLPFFYEPPGVSPSPTFSSIPSRTTSITTNSVKKKKHQSDGSFYGWTWKEEKERQHKNASFCSSPPSTPSSKFPTTTITTTTATTIATATAKPRRSKRAATVGQPPQIDTTGRNTMVGNISGDTTTSGDIDAGLESLSSASSSTETSVETPETGKKLIDQIPSSPSFTDLKSSTAAMLNMPKYNATTGNLSRRSQLVWQQEEEEEDKPLKRQSFIVKLWKSLSRKKK